MASSLSSFRGQVNCFIVVYIDCLLTFAAFYFNFKEQKKLTVSWHTPNRVNIK